MDYGCRVLNKLIKKYKKMSLEEYRKRYDDAMAEGNEIMKRYTHNKTGDYYEVITNKGICATNAYAGARLVVYRKLNRTNEIFVRDYNEFMEKFTLNEEVMSEAKKLKIKQANDTLSELVEALIEKDFFIEDFNPNVILELKMALGIKI